VLIFFGLVLMLVESSAAEEISMPPLKPGERVNAAAVVEPHKLGAGRGANVYVKMRIALGHHVCGLEKLEKGSLAPTKIEVKLPEGFSLDHEWWGPKAEKLEDGSSGYTGDVVFRNGLRAKPGSASGKLKIEIKISFQVCNEALCWPPEEISREIELEVEAGTEAK
jgi:DsbC/DsbD-like thiol-disulfide interchange protein